MGAGYIAELRRAGDPDSLFRALHELAVCLGPQRLPALITTLFANASQVSAQRFGAADYAFLTQHWDAFQALPISNRLVVLGRMLAPKEALPGPDTRQRGAEGGLAKRGGSGRRVAAPA
jgi:hypothetical protein